MKIKNLFSKTFIVQILILISVTGIIYFGNYSNSFTGLDDRDEIVTNPLIDPVRSSISDIFEDFATFHYYVPFKHIVNLYLNKISYMNPHISHLLSDFIHIFNVILCFLIVLIISKKRRIAFLTALFFAISPTASAAVNEIAARGHLFAAFFGISSFLFYIFADSKYIKLFTSRILRFFSILLYFIGLFFWPTFIGLPILIFIYELLKDEYITINELFFRLLLPFTIAATFCLTINFFIIDMHNINMSSYLVINSSGNPEATLGSDMEPFYKIWGLSSIYKLPIMFAEYIILCFKMPYFDMAYLTKLSPVQYIIRFLIIILFVLISILIYKKDKKLILAPTFFIVFLLPGILFLYPTEAMGLRYLYMPLIGIYFMVFAFLEYYVFSKDMEPIKKWIIIFLISLSALFFSISTYTRKYLWENDETILNGVILNGGHQAFLGWFLKAERAFSDKEKLIYIEKAQEEFEKLDKKSVKHYENIKNNLESLRASLQKVVINQSKSK